MDRILGIDYGEKRIGLALSDPFGWTAQPFSTITVKNRRQVFSELNAVIQEYDVRTLVFGLPLGLNSEEGPQALKVKEFAHQFEVFLKKTASPFNLQMAFMDERLSTAGAERVLIEADLSRRRRREVIDKQSASFMLQGYLQLHAQSL